MKLIYSEHAIRRMKQRGITEMEIEYVLDYPTYVKKTFEGRKEAMGIVKSRIIKVVFFEIENYLKIITII